MCLVGLLQTKEGHMCFVVEEELAVIICCEENLYVNVVSNAELMA